MLKSIISSAEEDGSDATQIRLGDVSSEAVALKQKYQENKALLASLPGVDRSIEQQMEEIERIKRALVRKA